VVADVIVRHLRRRVLKDFRETFECSCESDERQSEAVWGNFARGHLLLASVPLAWVGQGKYIGLGGARQLSLTRRKLPFPSKT
jgi:hypothetical protein